ncbi:MAG: GIY-YIG nuclease family protein [Parvularculaceae bacterium]
MVAQQESCTRSDCLSTQSVYIAPDRIPAATPIGAEEHLEWIYVFHFPRESRITSRLHPEEVANKKVLIAAEKRTVSRYYLHLKFLASNITLQIFGRKKWLCKVGLTEREMPQKRIADEIRQVTALPELPCITRQLRVPNCEHFEKAIHATLKSWHRHYYQGAGTEWFFTNPEEVESLWKRELRAWRRQVNKRP